MTSLIAFFAQQQLLHVTAASVLTFLAKRTRGAKRTEELHHPLADQTATAVWVQLQKCSISNHAENQMIYSPFTAAATNIFSHPPFPPAVKSFKCFIPRWLTPNDCSSAVCRSSFSTVRLQSEHTHKGSWRALGVLAGCAVPFWPEIPASEGTALSLRSHRHRRQRSPAV